MAEDKNTDGQVKTETDIDREHKKRMVRRNAVFEKVMEHKTIAKGLLILNCGDGKGKSTAAFGMIMRSIGHGRNVGIAQFIKGNQATGELMALEKFGDQVQVARYGEGFTWQTQDRRRDIELAEKTWARGKEFIADPDISMVLLDELNYAMGFGYIDPEEVISAVKARAPDKHVIITGRNPPDALVAIADLVTEMKAVKHPFAAGIKPQEGIEF